MNVAQTEHDLSQFLNQVDTFTFSQTFTWKGNPEAHCWHIARQKESGNAHNSYP